MPSNKNIIIVSATPTITAGLYSEGDSVGGLIKLKSNELIDNQRVLLQGVILTDLSGQSGNIDAVFFDSKPTATTFTNDVTLDMADADLTKIQHIEQITTYSAFNDNSASVNNAVSIPIVFTDSIYVALVARSTPTYTSTSDLTLRVILIQR